MSKSTVDLAVDDLAELGRKVKDALDLALAGGAPLALLEKLSASSGLIQALAELPRHALIPDVVIRAHRALGAWQEWQKRARHKPAA